MSGFRENPYKNPSIDIFGVRLDEPVTMLTDLLVTAVCIYAWMRLRKRKDTSLIHSFYTYFFLTMGIATALGGFIGHSFNYALSIYWKIPGWYVSMISIALAERASIFYAKKLIKPAFAQFFKWLNVAELVTFMIISVVTMDFYFVVGHSAYGMLIVVAGFQGYVFYKTRQKGSYYFLIGILWSTFGAVVYVQEWAISNWFNHMDIGHVLMALTTYYCYLGAKYNLDDPDYKIKWR